MRPIAPNSGCASGWISQPHQSIVCLANRLVIRLSTKGPSDVDFIGVTKEY